MSFYKSPEFKVGAFVVILGGLIAFMSVQISDDASFAGKTKKAWFLLPNASGLIKGSAVKSAGIPVGVIRDIQLQDGQARIDISVRYDLGLTRSASVEMRANGILGDKHIEVSPGAGRDTELEEGGQILNVKNAGSLDDVMTRVAEIADSLKDVSVIIKEALADDGTNKHILGRIVKNIEKLSGDIAQITSENKEQIHEIVDQVHDITSTLDDLINDDGDNGFKKTWANTMERLNTSMKNIENITNKLNNGEGTLGKLISDEKTSEDVSSAIEGISGLVDTANKVSTGIDFNAHYLSAVGAAKTAVGVTIQPGLDRYYYLGIITDPAGVVEHTKVQSSVNGGAETTTDKVATYYSRTKLTALYGKNFFNWTLRGGLIESTGGIGIDLHLLNHKLTTSVEAYDFEKLQLRAYLNYKLFYGIYLTGGFSDILNKREVRSGFVGAGLYLTNDDLKLLLTKSPF